MPRTKTSVTTKSNPSTSAALLSPLDPTHEAQLIDCGSLIKEKAVSMRDPLVGCAAERMAVKRQKRGRCEQCEWSGEQQQLLYRLHSQVGNRWSVISRSFSGRSDNSVKNHFFSRLRMALRHLNKQTQQLNGLHSRSIKPHVLYKIVSVCEERLDPNTSLLPHFIQSAVDLKHNILTYLYNRDEQITQSEVRKLHRDLINFNINYKVRNLQEKTQEVADFSSEEIDKRSHFEILSPKSTHPVEPELTKLELASSASPYLAMEGGKTGEELIERAPILLQSPFLSIQPLFQPSNYLWEQQIFPDQQSEDEHNSYFFCADLQRHWANE